LLGGGYAPREARAYVRPPRSGLPIRAPVGTDSLDSPVEALEARLERPSADAPVGGGPSGGAGLEQGAPVGPPPARRTCRKKGRRGGTTAAPGRAADLEDQIEGRIQIRSSGWAGTPPLGRAARNGAASSRRQGPKPPLPPPDRARHPKKTDLAVRCGSPVERAAAPPGTKRRHCDLGRRAQLPRAPRGGASAPPRSIRFPCRPPRGKTD